MAGMDAQEIPEQAIGTFERINNLRVTVHDLRGSLWPFLLPDRFRPVRAPDTACRIFRSAKESRRTPPERRLHALQIKTTPGRYRRRAQS